MHHGDLLDVQSLNVFLSALVKVCTSGYVSAELNYVALYGTSKVPPCCGSGDSALALHAEAEVSR